MKKRILKQTILALVLFTIIIIAKRPLCAEASIALKAGITYEPVTGNLDDVDLPAGTHEFYSHENPYFVIACGSDVFLKKVTLYIYNSSGTQIYLNSVTPSDVYFRYTNIQPGQLSAGSYSYEWEYTYTIGNVNNNNSTSQSGKISFTVNDLTYNVTYNANGGSGAPSSQAKIYGKTLTLSNIKPTRTGYTFKGWSTSSTATSATYQPGEKYSSNSNITLYAVWEINKYTVSYNANGGSGAPSAQTKTYGTTLTLSSVTPTRTGYTFKGWATSSTATSATYQPGEKYSSNSNITLYAVWEINKYTVSYNANGGSGAPSAQTKTYGTTLTLSSVTPTRDGYTFKGWSTSSTATSAIYQPGGNYINNDGTTLYAVWQKNPDGTSNTNGNNNNGNGANNNNSSTPNIDTDRNQTITAKSKTITKGTKSFYINAKTSGNGKLTYSSSNKKVITVNSAGKIVVKGYGKATITIKASETTQYDEAYKKITITVVPNKVSLKKFSSPGKKRLSASWKKDKTVSGYQVQLCARKDFKKGVYQKRFSKSKSKMGIYGLKSEKVFYIRVRAYKKIGKSKYYGPWSKVKKVKIR